MVLCMCNMDGKPGGISQVSARRWCRVYAAWMVSLVESPRCLPADGAVHMKHSW
ncbi:unnamed protein product [Staurois parvus]|uniref:Uncharacterized protein n=1 Tax=Staurois parvus TaxID=386267 RepID=A0ABN9CM13_9NEOB|nr:unnamed protein product [Staurois parvus]